MKIRTPLGTLEAKLRTDKDFPGIGIYIGDVELTRVEYTSSYDRIQALVWDNPEDMSSDPILTAIADVEPRIDIFTGLTGDADLIMRSTGEDFWVYEDKETGIVMYLQNAEEAEQKGVESTTLHMVHMRAYDEAEAKRLYNAAVAQMISYRQHNPNWREA